MPIWCTRCGGEKEASDFRAHPLKLNGKHSWCRACEGEVHTEYCRRQKEKWIEYKGGICHKCGASGLHPAAYQFHHRDPGQKKFSFDTKSAGSFERVRKELDKCDLLCANCHLILHAKY